MADAHWTSTYVDGAKVSKAAVRNGFRDHVPWFGTLTELRAAQLSGCRSAVVNLGSSAVLFMLDAADTTTADNGSSVIVSANGGRYKNQSRELLTANRTYYVATTGSDSNTGLSAGAPFLTLAKAWATCLKLDMNGYNVTVSLAAGTYTAGLSATGRLVGGKVTFSGAGATTVIQVSGGNACFYAALGAEFTVSNLKMTSGSGSLIYADVDGVITLGSGLDFGATTGPQIRTTPGGKIRNTYGASYTISGDGSHHFFNDGGLMSISGLTVNASGSRAFTQFAYSVSAGQLTAYAFAFTGTFTGQRYLVGTNGIVNSYGGGANYFPGSTAGNAVSGGQYV